MASIKISEQDKDEVFRQLVENLESTAKAQGVENFPNIVVLDDAIQLVFEIPEGEELDVTTRVVDDRLEIKGKVITNLELDLPNATGSASYQRNFSQSINLGVPIDESKIGTAQDENKLLVTLPKE